MPHKGTPKELSETEHMELCFAGHMKVHAQDKGSVDYAPWARCREHVELDDSLSHIIAQCSLPSDLRVAQAMNKHASVVLSTTALINWAYEHSVTGQVFRGPPSLVHLHSFEIVKC